MLSVTTRVVFSVESSVKIIGDGGTVVFGNLVLVLISVTVLLTVVVGTDKMLFLPKVV